MKLLTTSSKTFPNTRTLKSPTETNKTAGKSKGNRSRADFEHRRCKMSVRWSQPGGVTEASRPAGGGFQLFLHIRVLPVISIINKNQRGSRAKPNHLKITETSQVSSICSAAKNRNKELPQFQSQTFLPLKWRPNSSFVNSASTIIHNLVNSLNQVFVFNYQLISYNYVNLWWSPTEDRLEEAEWQRTRAAGGERRHRGSTSSSTQDEREEIKDGATVCRNRNYWDTVSFM